MLVIGIIATLVTGSLGAWADAPTDGWCFAALLYSSTVWLGIAKLDATQTQKQASVEEPASATADLLVVLLSVASLFSVAFVLVQASRRMGLRRGFWPPSLW